MSELSAYNEFFSKSRHRKVYITLLPSREVIDANQYLIQESISLEESLYSDENIRFGACESSCLRMTISREIDIPKDSFFDISFSSEGDAGVLIDSDGNYIVDDNNNRISYTDNSSYTETKLGRFKVMSVKPTKDRLYQDLVCYDVMNYILNENVAGWYENLTFPMSLYDFRRSFFYRIGIQEVTTTLINDNFMIQGGFVVSEEVSGKTIIEAICELNGVFGHITKDNEFEYISLPGSETVELDHYQNGTCVYEDYVTDAFTGVIAYSEDGNVGDMVGTDVNPYLIQNNYLLWGSEGTQDIEDALTNLLTKISSVQFRPFSVRTYGNPMLPLGTPITMTSLNGSISSVVMSKYMSGIQNLRDELSAVGDKAFPNDINSTKKEIMRSKGTRTMVEKLNGKVCVKIDSNGNLGLAEVGADPDDGLTYVTISAQYIDIESDTVSFNNDGYEVRGDIYTTKITPDNNEIYCDYSEIIDKSKFPDVDFTKDTKATEHKNTYVKYSDIAGTTEDNLEAFNLTISSSTSFSSHYANPGGVEPYWYSNIYADVVVTGKHYVMLSDSWTQFKADGGYIDDDGYLVFAAGKTWDDYVSYGMGGLGLMYQSFLTRGTTAIENFIKVVAYLKPEDYRPVSLYNVSGTGIPIVLAPQRSIGDSGDFDFVNKWGSSGTSANYGLANVIGTMWNKMLNPRPLVKAGTLVKSINATANHAVFTNGDIRQILGLPQGTTISSANTTVYITNGDHDAQSVDVDYTYKSSIYWYAHFNGTPSAGNYRFNYIIVYFGD